MGEELCELTELPKISCAHCRGCEYDESEKQYVKVEKPQTWRLFKK